MVLGWRIRAAIYRFGQALAAHKKGLPVSPFFYPSISRFMPSAFELSDLIAKALAPKPKAKSCPAGGICYQFIRESPNIFKPAEIQHVQTGGHSTSGSDPQRSANLAKYLIQTGRSAMPWKVGNMAAISMVAAPPVGQVQLFEHDRYLAWIQGCEKLAQLCCGRTNSVALTLQSWSLGRRCQIWSNISP